MGSWFLSLDSAAHGNESIRPSVLEFTDLSRQVGFCGFTCAPKYVFLFVFPSLLTLPLCHSASFSFPLLSSPFFPPSLLSLLPTSA